MNTEQRESIMISTERKNALIFSLILFIILTGLKCLIVGLWLGKKLACKK
ncbi:MAG: hypothetical protein FWC91_07980 [Defluviitaleaceae bacterium]|nr:hypothetical protein [Defluviitaleaceae bacterium]